MVAAYYPRTVSISPGPTYAFITLYRPGGKLYSCGFLCVILVAANTTRNILKAVSSDKTAAAYIPDYLALVRDRRCETAGKSSLTLFNKQSYIQTLARMSGTVDLEKYQC